MDTQEEIKRRRTFAIISHPDAGKTTLTEKLLLFGGQIQVAGAVKSNKIKKTATSDWMEIEKQRGISVTTSVMEFDYNGYKINILDTPGHQDFAEDTFRTLTAVDSVIIVGLRPTSKCFSSEMIGSLLLRPALASPMAFPDERGAEMCNPHACWEGKEIQV